MIAGAGTGKTRALTHRFAYLVNDLGILPGNILCVTFSNKAANEMRQRIRRVTGDNDTGYICTFHSFCVSVLQEDSYAVGYPQSFLVLDNADIDAMLQVIYDERKITLREKTFGKARDMIEILKTIERPDYYIDLSRFRWRSSSRNTLMRAKLTTSFSMGICISRKNALDSITTTLSLSRCIFSTISPILR